MRTAGIEVHFTADVDEAWEAVGPHLMADPIIYNAALTGFAAARRDRPPGRFWWTTTDSAIAAIAFQSSLERPIAVIGMRPSGLSTIPALVDTISVAAPEVVGVVGEVRIATAFAAEWGRARGVSVTPAMTQSYYHLPKPADRSPANSPAAAVDGAHLRLARPDDLALGVEWAIGFQRDAFGNNDGGNSDGAGSSNETGTETEIEELTTWMRNSIDNGETWFWSAEQPLAMAACTSPIGAVSRIRHVYTPAENRNRGLAGACVSALVNELFATGDVDHCVLYADLANPTSNAVYRRLGFVTLFNSTSYDFARPTELRPT